MLIKENMFDEKRDVIFDCGYVVTFEEKEKYKSSDQIITEAKEDHEREKICKCFKA